MSFCFLSNNTQSCPTFFVHTRKAGQAQRKGRGCGAHTWPSKQPEGSRRRAFTNGKRRGSKPERRLFEQMKPAPAAQVTKREADPTADEPHEIPGLAVPEQLTSILRGHT